MLVKVISIIFYYATLPFIILYAFLIKKKKEIVIWGPIPMINYKYWSIALSKDYKTKTLVSNHYNIHSINDFTLSYNDILPNILSYNRYVKLAIGPIFAFCYAMNNAKIINISNRGSFLGGTPIWFIEAYLFKIFGIKTVLTGYGSDYYMYSKISDPSLKHALLLSYPEKSKIEKLIEKKVVYWTKYADIIIGSFATDGIGRWDCLPVNMVTISNDKIIKMKELKRQKNKEVTIVHSPNHRGFKGTEFIIQAINELKEEGLNIKFILIENMKNREVLKILKEEADILVEQIIVGYGLNGIEGMGNGLAVLSNLDGLYYRKLRRYSYLKECPIISTTPENIKENLRLLIENKELREELGRLGVDYVKKYHSEETAQYMYGKIYNQLLNGVDEDLINLFHPLKSEYNKKNYIKTPLSSNQYIAF